MRAEIISIGTEILLGEITDTNATAISKALNEIGVDVLYRTTVGDNAARIAEVVRQALARTDVVIASGGLGPTTDDVTREGIAQAAGVPLVFNEILFESIAERFRQYGVPMSSNNRRQAHIPKGALPIVNPVGTAPIFILKVNDGAVMVLPGVPREMTYLLTSELLPWVKARMGENAIILSHTLRTIGVGESTLDEKLADLMGSTNPTVGMAAKMGQVDLRITAKAASKEDAHTLIAPVEAEIRGRLGDLVYATGTTPIENVVRKMLGSRSVAAIEIGTEGAFGARLGIETTQLESVNDLEGIDVADDPQATVEAIAVTMAQQADFGVGYLVTTDDNGQHGAYAVLGDGYANSRIFSWATPREGAAEWISTQVLAMLRSALMRP